MVQVLNVRASIQLFFTLIILVSLGVLTFNLGLWQQNRAAQKIILDEQQRRAVQLPVLSLNETFVSPRAFNHRLLELNGRWVDDAVVYIDNRQIQGNPAVQVIQGFQPTGYNFLIPIDRGYLLRNPNNPRLAPEQPKSNVPTTGPVTVIIQVLDGFSRSAELRRFFSTNQAKTEPAFFENVNTPEGLRMSGYANQNSDQIVQSVSNGYLVWSNFDMQVFEQKTQRPMSSFVGRIHHQFDSNPLQAQSIFLKNGYYQLPITLNQQISKHEGYAFQWFGLTGVLFLLGSFFVYREFFAINKPCNSFKE